MELKLTAEERPDVVAFLNCREISESATGQDRRWAIDAHQKAVALLERVRPRRGNIASSKNDSAKVVRR
jgi:hypothetical protein